MVDAPPPALTNALTAADFDRDLDATLLLGQHTGELVDIMGTAVVGCLTQAAVRSNSDALWKPINNQVCCVCGVCGGGVACGVAGSY